MPSTTRASDLLRFAASVLSLAAAAAAQETTRVSVSSTGAEANGYCVFPNISADGRCVAFESNATNLVPGDRNGHWDVFVHDRTTGITERVSVDSSGAEADDDSAHSSYPTPLSISADGRFVAFESLATNLVAGDTNGFVDVFVHDRATGATERVSVDSTGAEGNQRSVSASISADGRFVAFLSWASNLVANDTNGHCDTFVHDRQSGTTQRVSIGSHGLQANGDSWSATISADGAVVTFASNARNLVAGGSLGNQVFAHDLATGITEIVSVDSSGSNYGSGGSPSISADGRVVAFISGGANLVNNDTNGRADAFIHDRGASLTERVSVSSSGQEGRKDCDEYASSISSDGEVVVFSSWSWNLSYGDTNQCLDVFLHDRASGTTRRVSRDSSGGQGDANSFQPSVSADGQIVAFTSWATNLVAGDTNGFCDVFVDDVCPAAASWSDEGAGIPGTHGVPSFTSRQNPVFGTTITLDLANSYGPPTTGLLYVASKKTGPFSGGSLDLSVAPDLVIPITLSIGGAALPWTIPADRTLCGVLVDLQAVEVDPGAALGKSSTQVLELVLGR